MRSKIKAPGISNQPYLQNEIFTIEGNLDYRQMRDFLMRADELLRVSGVEEEYVHGWVGAVESEAGRKLAGRNLDRQREHASRGLRCTILRVMLGSDYRDLSVRLADSNLLRWFIGIGDMRGVMSPSKSTLERYEKRVPEEVVRGLVLKMARMAAQPVVGGRQALGLAECVDLERYFLDMTCVKGLIHFPVDWVLLRDGVRTLVKAMRLIRDSGIKNRMADVDGFLKLINRWSMAMAMQSRRSGSKKARKRILRKLKKIVGVVVEHAKKHRALLDKQWEEGGWSRAEAEAILKRMDNVIEQMPAAVKQAHDRIIGGRQVANSEKILSLYEGDMNVVVRGKAGAAVEFGNTLRLGEVESGLIIDWKLYEGQAPCDIHAAMDGVERVCLDFPGKIKTLVMDRGGYSADNEKKLKRLRITSAVCPKNPAKLSKMIKDPVFCDLQKRRAQTEARIGIFKNCFLGRPFRSKGFAHRELLVTWGVFVHNLWVIARMEKAEDKKPHRERRRKIRSSM